MSLQLGPVLSIGRNDLDQVSQKDYWQAWITKENETCPEMVWSKKVWIDPSQEEDGAARESSDNGNGSEYVRNLFCSTAHSTVTMNFKNNKISLRRSDVQKTLKVLNGMITRNGGRGWINWLLKVNYTIRGGNTAALARSAVICVRFFHSLYRSQGIRGLVLYTKNAYILLMQAVATGKRPHNARNLGSVVGLDRSGIPSVIPREHRRRIRSGDRQILRIWVSWFSIYRVLTFPSPLKLGTITAPGLDLSKLEVEKNKVITLFISKVLHVKEHQTLDDPSFVPLSKSTPSILKGKDKVSWSPLGIVSAASALMYSPVYIYFLGLQEWYTEKCTFRKA